MQLFNGTETEYIKRHREIWPQLTQLLKDYGVSDYSLFFDETSHSIIGVLTSSDPSKLDLLPQEPLMKKWWVHMADLMETNEDHSPVQLPLKEVFFIH